MLTTMPISGSNMFDNRLYFELEAGVDVCPGQVSILRNSFGQNLRIKPNFVHI
jgi:hypothetical protein